MMLRLLSGIEVLLQMMLGIGLYLVAGRHQKQRKRWERIWLIILLLFIYYAEVWDKKSTLLSWGSTFLTIVMEGLWLWLWTGGSKRDVFSWIFFSRWTIVLAEMPAVIISSFRGGAYEGMGANIHPDPLGKGIQCAFLLVIVILCRNRKSSLFNIVMGMKRTALLGMGLGECLLVLYLMNVIWEAAQGTDLVLNVVLIICMFSALLVQMLEKQHQITETKNKMYLTKEKLLEKNYRLLKQEINNNHKAGHDHRFDLAYLYECFRTGDTKKGMDYIEKKRLFEKTNQRMERWTGYECIDFLIRQMKIRAEKEEVEFSVSANMTQIPMPEYDFFTVLGNLLDNAVEAAVKCRAGERAVRLHMKSANDMFLLTLENTYETEPQKKKGAFLSSKEEKEKHGWGLINAREIVERNGGIVKIEYGNHVFLARIIFGRGGLHE